MPTVRYYHSPETVTDLSKAEAFAAGVDAWLDEVVQAGSSLDKTIKFLAPVGLGDLAVAAINVSINGDRNEITIDEVVIDAAGSALVAAALTTAAVAALGLTAAPVFLAVGTAIAGEYLYNTFFDDDVHNIIEQVNGTVDQDLRLYDDQGNWVGGGFYVDGFDGLTEAQAIANLTAEMIASGHLPSSGDGYTVRVHNTASTTANTVTLYDLENGTSHTYNTHDTGGGTVGDTDQPITITTGYGDDLIEGGAGNDDIKSLGGQNLIYGFDGDDKIQTPSSSGSSTIRAGEGDDSVYADGHDTVFGDAGNDTIRIYANSIAYGGTGNDSLTSYSNSSTTNNVFYGGAGDDFISTGGGNSTASGGSGNDRFYSNGVYDILNGGSGNDYFTLASTYVGKGGRLINGGSGTDTVKLTGLSVVPWNLSLFLGGTITVTSTGGVIIKKTFASAGGDTIEGAEYLEFNNATIAVADIVKPIVTGTNIDDVLVGTAAPNTILGDIGNDSLSGAGASDTLDGGAGADTLNGGDGNDIASYNSATSGITIDLANTSNNTGDATGDVFQNIEGIEGTDFDDTLTGDANDNSLLGGSGNDSIIGNDGADSLYGGTGADTLIGGDGDDLLISNEGNDFLTGGTGADTFSFAAGDNDDTILDFNIVDDILDFSQTHTDFIEIADVVAAASDGSQNGLSGTLIDLGANDSLFLAGLTVADLNSISIAY